MIKLNSLTYRDINRSVVYRDQLFGKVEEGIITSFNNRYIFVRYGNDKHSKATRPEDLEWVVSGRIDGNPNQ